MDAAEMNGTETETETAETERVKSETGDVKKETGRMKTATGTVNTTGTVKTETGKRQLKAKNNEKSASGKSERKSAKTASSDGVKKTVNSKKSGVWSKEMADSVASGQEIKISNAVLTDTVTVTGFTDNHSDSNTLSMTSLSAFSKTEEQTDGEVGEKNRPAIAWKDSGDCFATLKETVVKISLLLSEISGDKGYFVCGPGEEEVRHLDTRTLKEFSGVIKEMSGVAKELFGSEDDAGETLRVEFSDDAFDCGG